MTKELGGGRSGRERGGLQKKGERKEIKCACFLSEFPLSTSTMEISRMALIGFAQCRAKYLRSH